MNLHFLLGIQRVIVFSQIVSICQALNDVLDSMVKKGVLVAV